MSDNIKLAGNILNIQVDETDEPLKILKAVASEPRLRILDLLANKVYNVSEISEALGLPISTTVLHIKTLEEAKLLKTELRPGSRGLQKICARVYDSLFIELSRGEPLAGQELSISMPIGAFVDFQVSPTCGLVSETSIIGLFDDPSSFYEPERIRAQLLWFKEGFVEYRFPNRLPPEAILDSLQLSLEICSEAPLHQRNWPSDITLWINQHEIGTWTSPSDFGGEHGALTPKWWENWNSQYGLLKVWQVNGSGGFIDGVEVSNVRVEDLNLQDHNFINVRVGVKPDARNVGGLNIFGRLFGNYPQDILLRLIYHYATDPDGKPNNQS
ncbi:MAG: helix-turn-helix domain-containing protein [Anaerolineales bacterium]|nr:helix-turn-helix domain-containing protein [Anaerolineales bacterium]